MVDGRTSAELSSAPLPRLRARRLRPGHVHPAGVADIARVLRFFGEHCTYGVRSVELAQGASRVPASGLRLGRLVVPGRIILYDQPPSPWTLRGALHPAVRDRLCRSGAIVTPVGGAHTIVAWPAETLRDFMLFDVLMHEVGHHLIQQYKGKRPARVARTRDHEAFADLFARQCRDRYQADAPT